MMTSRGKSLGGEQFEYERMVGEGQRDVVG